MKNAVLDEYYAIMNKKSGKLLRRYNLDSTQEYKGEHVLRATNIDESTPEEALKDTMPRLFNCKDKARRCLQRYCNGVYAYMGDPNRITMKVDPKSKRPMAFRPVKDTARNIEDFTIVKVGISL